MTKSLLRRDRKGAQSQASHMKRKLSLCKGWKDWFRGSLFDTGNQSLVLVNTMGSLNMQILHILGHVQWRAILYVIFSKNIRKSFATLRV